MFLKFYTFNVRFVKPFQVPIGFLIELYGLQTTSSYHSSLEHLSSNDLGAFKHVPPRSRSEALLVLVAKQLLLVTDFTGELATRSSGVGGHVTEISGSEGAHNVALEIN